MTDKTKLEMKALLGCSGLVFSLLVHIPIWLFLVWQILKTIEMTPVILTAFVCYGVSMVFSSIVNHFAKRTVEEVNAEKARGN